MTSIGVDNEARALMMQKMSVTKEEVDKLEILKKEINKLSSSTPGLNYILTWGDELNLRYLRGHQYNMNKVIGMMLDAAKWRNEFGTDKIIQKWEADNSDVAKFFKGYWPVGLLGKDPVGRYIALNGLSDIDFPVVMKEVGMEKTLGFAMYLMEKSQSLNPYGDSIIIMDLGQGPNPPITSFFEVNAWINGLLAYLKAIAGPNDMAYPEAYIKILVTRAPAMFSSVFAMVKPFLPERTKLKIAVMSDKDAYDYLKTYVDEDVIPEFLGGKNKLKTVGGGGKLKKGFLSDKEFMHKMELRAAEREILLKRMLGVEDENSAEAKADNAQQEKIEAELQVQEEQAFAQLDTTPLSQEEIDERKRESLRIQEATALEFLRAAIHDMKRVSVGAYTRGSWRYLPGIEILETLSDVELMEKFRNNDNNIQKMVGYLRRVAEDPSLLNEPPAKSTPVAPTPSKPATSSQKSSTVSISSGSSSNQKISTDITVSPLSSSGLKVNNKKDSFVALKANKDEEDDDDDLNLIGANQKKCGFCC